MVKLRVVQGFTDLGRVRVPQMPVGMVLTDRATGTLYLLSHDANGALVLQTPPPVQWHGVAYGPWDGPVLGGPAAPRRLYISAGTLGIEAGPSGMASSRIMTRNFSRPNETYEITYANGAFVLTLQVLT